MARCLKYTPQLLHHTILTSPSELRDEDLFHEMTCKKKKKKKVTILMQILSSILDVRLLEEVSETLQIIDKLLVRI